MNREWIKDTLSSLLNTPSPSGYCKKVMTLLGEIVADLGYEMTLTNKGNGVIEIPGQNPNYTAGIAAHVDTLGAMVRAIKSNGSITFTTVGGYTMHSVEGEYVTIHTRDGKEYTGTILNTEPSVHVFKGASDQDRKIENMEIRLDERVTTKDQVLALGIQTGDFISLDPRAVWTESDYIKSRHLDDKAGVMSILAFLKALKDQQIQPRVTLKIIISTYEEVGHGSSFLPADLKELIGIDMGAMGSDLTCTEHQVSICAKDSSGPYDYDIVSALIEAAKNEALDYAVDIYPYYGSDVSAALRAGYDLKGGLIGPGVHASHHMERTHLDGIIQTAKLLLAYFKA